MELDINQENKEFLKKIASINSNLDEKTKRVKRKIELKNVTEKPQLKRRRSNTIS